MTLKHITAAAALALLSTTAVQAADIYAGVSLGASRWSIADQPGFTIDKSDTGYKLVLGTQFTPNIGAELGYASLGTAKISGGGGTGEVKGSGWFVDLVGTLPLSGSLSGFAKLGVFNGKAKASGAGGAASDSGTDVKYGLGLSYALSKTVDLRGEWERYRFNLSGDKGDVDLLSVGVNFKF